MTILVTSQPSPAELERLADLTSRYARYSHSAGGLSSVAGGVLCALAYMIWYLVPLTPDLRFALAAVPLPWLACKELLRHFYYQRFGAVAQRVDDRNLALRQLTTILVAFLSACAVVLFVAKLGRAVLVWPVSGDLAIVMAMPFIAWRCLRSGGDYGIGLFLLSQSALVLAGSDSKPEVVLVAIISSAAAIIVGLREHCDYLALRRDLALGHHE